MQVNCEPEALGPDNPYAIGFVSKERDLTHELDAIRNVNFESSRIWKIKNNHVRNRLTGLQKLPAWLTVAVVSVLTNDVACPVTCVEYAC